MASITIHLDEKLARRLEQAVAQSGWSRSEVVRDALRRQLALRIFDQIRERIIPFAEAAGFFTDEDVFRSVS